MRSAGPQKVGGDEQLREGILCLDLRHGLPVWLVGPAKAGGNELVHRAPGFGQVREAAGRQLVLSLNLREVCVRACKLLSERDERAPGKHRLALHRLNEGDALLLRFLQPLDGGQGIPGAHVGDGLLQSLPSDCLACDPDQQRDEGSLSRDVVAQAHCVNAGLGGVEVSGVFAPRAGLHREQASARAEAGHEVCGHVEVVLRKRQATFTSEGLSQQPESFAILLQVCSHRPPVTLVTVALRGGDELKGLPVEVEGVGLGHGDFGRPPVVPRGLSGRWVGGLSPNSWTASEGGDRDQDHQDAWHAAVTPRGVVGTKDGGHRRDALRLRSGYAENAENPSTSSGPAATSGRNSLRQAQHRSGLRTATAPHPWPLSVSMV